MADEPDNIVLRRLAEIRATQSEQSKQLEALPRLERQMDDLTKVITYALGQTTKVELRQSEHQKRIDELFDELGKLLADKQPV